MRKFENCDIFSVLGTIVAHNTKHYQTDFDIDKDILTEAAEENSVPDRRYLWMSRPCGTHCLKEKDVFLRDTSEYNTWTAYETGADEIVAYAIQVNGYEDGVLKGNLYELDYASHCAMVKDKAVLIGHVRLFCDSGDVYIPYSDDWRNIARQYCYNERKFIPANVMQYDTILVRQQTDRLNGHFYPWNEEKLKLEYGDKPVYRIYQLQREAYDYLFLSYYEANEKGFEFSEKNYELAYIAEDHTDHDPEAIFQEFNIDRPADFYGHSLSVSDVIAYSENGKSTVYFVDNFGVAELFDFFGPQKNSAEM